MKSQALSSTRKETSVASYPLTQWFRSLIMLIADYYSKVLERPVTFRQTLHLLHAQVAFVAAAFPVACPALLRMVFCAWLVHTLLVCKKAV